MKLIFDQNLSPRLANNLSDAFPLSVHVSSVGLARALDLEIWEYAKERGLTIVTNDSDFSDILVLRGSPPKVIWLRLGNVKTQAIESAIRNHLALIHDFLRSGDTGLLVLC